MFLNAPEGSGEDVSFAGRSYKVKNGVVEVPDASAADFLNHGFTVAAKQAEKSDAIKLIDAELGFLPPVLSLDELETELAVAEAAEKANLEAAEAAKKQVADKRQAIADAKEAAAKKAAKEAKAAADKAKAESDAKEAAAKKAAEAAKKAGNA